MSSRLLSRLGRSAVVVVCATTVVILPAPDPAAAIGIPRPASAIGSGFNHACAVVDGGILECWGAGTFGRLGQGRTQTVGDDPGEMGNNLPATDLGTGRTVVAVTGGDLHTCALLDDGSVKCWGESLAGQLGQGHQDYRGDEPGEMGDALPAVDLGTGRTATSITAGSAHTCALLDDGAVRCWGANYGGQLGIGDTDARGYGPGQMGDALPTVDLGTGRTATSITSGAFHTCALLDDARVKCWGPNADGALGLGTDDDGRGDEPGEMGDALPTVDLGTGRTATSVWARYWTTCAILDDGTTKCWGANDHGQLGLGDTDARGDEPGEMGDALPTVDLGTGRTATSVAPSYWHTCAVLDNGRVKCWGDSTEGQLGLGDRLDRGGAPGQMGDALPQVALGTGRTVAALVATASSTCALLDDQRVKCWGAGVSGQLGLGTLGDRGWGPGQMGDSLPAADLGSTAPPDGYEVDAEIRRSTQATFVGNEVLNATGANQTRSADLRRGRAVTFVVRLRNQAAADDDLRVRGTGTTGRVVVTYRVGGADVTARIVAGTHRFRAVAAGHTRTVTVRILALSSAPLNHSTAFLVTSRSVGDPTRLDAVRATVRTIR